MSAGLLSFVFIAFAALLGCAPSKSSNHPEAINRTASVEAPPLDAKKPVDMPGVHNLVAYTPDLISGSVPEGNEGFESLKKMGIQTIISVDGAAPDLELAKKNGFRYVHLPISYNGMTEARRLEIARAVRDLPGPIYLHCHHGKHRSAGAAAAASVSLGLLTNAEAVERMKVSGTAPNYKGLYACAENTTKASNAQINAASGEFPSIWKTSDFVEAMVEIDEVNDHLKAIEKAGWTTPKDHPDLVPAAEAKRIANYLNALAIAKDPVHDRGDEFKKWLGESRSLAESMEKLLEEKPAPAEKLTTQMKALQASCKTCHTKYRD